MKNIDWYNNLNKPFFNPPSELFAPVWIILYITIFISFILFIKSGMNKTKILPLTFFIMQMILNLSWQEVFFGMKNISGAFVIAVLMWVFILLTIISFYKHSKPASLILLPYFIWVSFACCLNFEYLRLN